MTKPTDSVSVTKEYEYDDKGNVTKLTDNNGSTSYVYDEYNRVIKSISPKGIETQYTYNAQDQMTSLSASDGLKVSRNDISYNMGLPTLMRHTGSAFNLIYDGEGRKKSVSVNNSYIASATYAELGNMRDEISYRNGTTLKAFKDIVGNVTGTSSGSQSLTDMDYDANDKLIRSCDLIKNVSYKYI